MKRRQSVGYIFGLLVGAFSLTLQLQSQALASAPVSSAMAAPSGGSLEQSGTPNPILKPNPLSPLTQLATINGRL